MAPAHMPKDAFTLEGGCNCHAVRYKVAAPPFAERARNPYHTLGVDIGDLRLPMTLICHCNNCRSATSSILPSALVAETSTVTVSVLTEAELAGREGKLDPTDDRNYSPAGQVFDYRNPKLKDLCLATFRSSPARNRWFCRRCGTPVAYSIDDGGLPESWGWPKMLDIWIGTVDRADLQQDWMAPERMLWCEKGVPWIRQLATVGGEGIPEHPLYKIDKVVGDDVEEDLKELARLGK